MKLKWKDTVPASVLCGYEVTVNDSPPQGLVAAAVGTEPDGRRSFEVAGLPGLLNGKNKVGLRNAASDGRRSEYAFVDVTVNIPLPPPADLVVE